MVAAEPERWLVVDAAASVEAINQVICSRLEQLLTEHEPLKG
jgi:thymidylate kinase